MKWLLLLISALCFAPSLANSQQKEGTAAPTAQAPADVGSEFRLPTDFLSLADLRATTNAEIATLEREAKEIEEEKLPRSERLQARLAQLTPRVDELTKKTTRTSREEEELARIKSEINFLQRDPPLDPQALSKRLGEIQQQLKTKRALASKIQTSIASMLSPEQEFKRTMSITFAALIATVIVGFFVIAFRDEKIRQAIFSGETGIQFLTLFSLVIAIILFGITQVLEGKELSALLGGLSGYILGRTVPRS